MGRVKIEKLHAGYILGPNVSLKKVLAIILRVSDNADNKIENLVPPVKVFGNSGRVFQWSDHFMGIGQAWTFYE